MRNFIKKNNIKKIVDLGCGDWHSTIYMLKDLNTEYVGYDVYKKLIEHNKKVFNNKLWSFNYLDIYNEKEKIEKGDVCIIKDVLQHWNNTEITSVLDYLTEKKMFKYIIICNNNNQSRDNEELLKTGEQRGLSIRYNPLRKYNPKFLFNYLYKEVSIIFL